MTADMCPRTSKFVYGQTRGPIYRPLSGDLSADGKRNDQPHRSLGIPSARRTDHPDARLIAVGPGFPNRGGGVAELGIVANRGRIRGEITGQVLPMVLWHVREAA